ncbi:hypothetical protein HZS_4204 [Henneguya salminicola]|nr:hypothetical protein HZS_4204 [Henneguya salminicola]
MQKYGIPAVERNSCMQFIRVLSVIPIDELEIGLATWFPRFEPKMWNIYDISKGYIRVRTNNYLERYNRHLNENFANTHPNLFGFIAGIQKDGFDYTMRARNIRSGSTLLQFDGDRFEKPTIPNGYTTYKNNL